MKYHELNDLIFAISSFKNSYFRLRRPLNRYPKGAFLYFQTIWSVERNFNFNFLIRFLNLIFSKKNMLKKVFFSIFESHSYAPKFVIFYLFFNNIFFTIDIISEFSEMTSPRVTPSSATWISRYKNNYGLLYCHSNLDSVQNFSPLG